MHVSSRPVTSFDPEGLIFAAGVDAEIIRLYDLRTFDKVCCCCLFIIIIKKKTFSKFVNSQFIHIYLFTIFYQFTEHT